MEDGGPHLPTKNEPLARQNPPQSWWQCCGEVGAFGPRYFHFWRAQPFFTLIHHLIFPLSLPMNLLWGTGNWLTYKTGFNVDWPTEVKQAVGPALQRG
jgi:hypothetical protein